jgi:hypothetical protein
MVIVDFSRFVAASVVRDDALVGPTRAEVARINVREDTWSGHVSRGQAPESVRSVGHGPVCLARDVDSWQRSRLGRLHAWRDQARAERGGRRYSSEEVLELVRETIDS